MTCSDGGMQSPFVSIVMTRFRIGFFTEGNKEMLAQAKL
jgi:hypothetical protein